jgi:predicted short-subunit dehydrogenase-like oxidoreductase (DUF2520 family)
VTKQSGRPSIAIVGAGKVGTAVGTLAARAGYRVTAVAGRDRLRTEQAASRIGAEVPVLSPHEAAGRAELILLAVPDDAIEATCRELVSARAFTRGSFVAHCSGALSSECLDPARRELGCHVASFHPLQSFPTVEAALASLPGSYCFDEGDEAALVALEALGAAIGARCVRIDTQHKVLYHAAAVMACNYLTGLLDAALSLATTARIERQTAWQALEPLIRATLENISKLGTEGALTGPIARGDSKTVTAHLAALDESAGELSGLYRALGSWTVDLALRKGSIEEDTARVLLEALAGRIRQGRTT